MTECEQSRSFCNADAVQELFNGRCEGCGGKIVEDN